MTTTAPEIPSVAKWLGIAGLLPFVLLALAVQFTDGVVRSELQFGLTAFGAVILSFLGGIHWGAATLSVSAFSFTTGGLSVLPSAVGWVGLVVPSDLGLVLLSLAFAGMLVIDLRAISIKLLPEWYGRLRWNLSIIVVPCLFSGAL